MLPASPTIAMRFPLLSILLGFSCLLSTTVWADKPGLLAAQQQIEQVLAEQAKAWNDGDVERFMDGYAKRADLRFASGGSVTRGWQETLDRYKQRYPDRKAMGALTFSELETTILSADDALVFGRWRLKTEQDEPNGLFTLIFRRTDSGWKIVADHTSAAN